MDWGPSRRSWRCNRRNWWQQLSSMVHFPVWRCFWHKNCHAHYNPSKVAADRFQRILSESEANQQASQNNAEGVGRPCKSSGLMVLLNVSSDPKYSPLILNWAPSRKILTVFLWSTTAGLSADFWMVKKAPAILTADEYIFGSRKDHWVIVVGAGLDFR